jgi:hypothetical protein
LSGVERFKSHHWFGYFFDNRRAILTFLYDLHKFKICARPLYINLIPAHTKRLFCRNRSASVGVDKTKGIPTRRPVI